MSQDFNSLTKILIIFLFFNDILLVFSEDINYNFDEGFSEKNETQTSILSNPYTLKFSEDKEKPKYIKVILTPHENQETPILCYSPIDPLCIKGRIVLSKRVDKKPAIAFVKKEEIENRNLNILVTCKKENCGYNIRFEGADKCQINADEGLVYSYALSSENKGMEFEVFGKPRIIEDVSFMNIGLEGSDDARIILNDQTKAKFVYYESVQFTTFQLVSDSTDDIISLTDFYIQGGKEGEYINLNVYISDNNKAPDNLLYPGGPPVLGIIIQDNISIPEIIFPVSALIEEKFSDITEYSITGKIYSKYASVYIGDENRKYIETNSKITDGLLGYLLKTHWEKIYIYFDFAEIEFDVKKDVIFSVSLIPINTNIPGFYYLPPPLLIGQTYRQILKKGKSMIYHGAKIDSSNERLNINLFNRKGITNMYMANYDNFPNFNYTMSDSSDNLQNMELIKNIGKIALYERKIEKTMEALDATKKVIFVQCLDDGNDEKGYCEFDISINTKGQIITLIEGENFYKYAMKDEEGIFRIYFNEAFKLKSLAVEIMVHNGEIIFNGNSSIGFNDNKSPLIKKFILANKVLLYFELNGETYNDLFVTFKAIKNSFFSIKYVYSKLDTVLDLSDEIIFPRENYLVEIDPNLGKKIIHILNDRYKTNENYVTTFYALNCDYKIFTNKTNGRKTEITFINDFAQDFTTKAQGDIYKSDYYDYEINIVNIDESNYNNKMCMLYVKGYQSNDSYVSPIILIGNNINQKIFFDFFDYYLSSINFLYPITDTSTDLFINLNVNNYCNYYYYIEISIGNNDTFIFEKSIAISTPIYLNKEQFIKYCPENSFCSLRIRIGFIFAYAYSYQKTPMIELTLGEAYKNSFNKNFREPSYLQKNKAKKDFIRGNEYYYLYTDIGKNDHGHILINFYRNLGNVYGRIVRKDIKDIEYDWMDMYRLPSSNWDDDDKNYDKYLQKYFIHKEDTEECIDGCYLILGIIIPQLSLENKFYPINVITQISQNDYSIIKIQMDEFILGNIDICNTSKIFQFYQVWFPYRTDQIQFDWHSELAGLYINIDDNLPNANTADFILLPNCTESILIINREEIIKKVQEKEIELPDGSLSNLKLTIGIWTDAADSADTEFYSLRIHEENLDYHYYYFNIIEVSTNQKILCKPIEINRGKYGCLFMVNYDDKDIKNENDLLLYTNSIFKNNFTFFYANFIDSYLFDYYEYFQEFRRIIPSSQNAQYDSERDNLDYLYIKLNNSFTDKYLIVSIESESPDDIMVISSLNTYNNYQQEDVPIYYPKSHSENLIQIKKELLIIEFPLSTSLYIHIESIDGQAELFWEENPNIVYNLKGRDLLTLLTPSNYRRLYLKKLNQVNPDYSDFIFLLSFYTRNPLINFDEVEFGSYMNLGYMNTDLPIFLYSKNSDYSNDINIVVKFKDIYTEDEGEYEKSPIEVNAYIEKRKSIYEAKTNPDLILSFSNRIQGKYDPSINTACVFLSDTVIGNDFKISPEDFATLLLSLKKSNHYEYLKYNIYNIQAQFTKENSLLIPIENEYIYGKYEGPLVHYYRLKVNKKKEIMKIILSFNSDRLNWAINNQASTNNSTNYAINTKKERGKIIITLNTKNEDSIYLNIFNNEYNSYLPLQNYVFKYINIEKEEEFLDYKIRDNNSSVKYKEEKLGDKIKITCYFNKIDIDNNEVNVIYLLKIVDEKYYIKGEDLNSIAVIESPFYMKYKKNPIDQDGIISLSAIRNFSTWYCFQIIAQIEQKNSLEYIVYDTIFRNKDLPLNYLIINLQEKSHINPVIGETVRLYSYDTDYNDTELNIFNSSDLEKFIFNNTLTDLNDINNIYKEKCRFWKTSQNIIKLFCDIDRTLINKYGTTPSFNFSQINIYYNNYHIKIMSYVVVIFQEEDFVPFIYSHSQIINLEGGNILSFKFKYLFYTNEHIYLFNDELKTINFDNCDIVNSTDLICQISQKKLKSFLSDKREKFYLANSNTFKGDYIIPTVEDIIIESNHMIKHDCFIKITKLLNNDIEDDSFFYYETNVTNLPEITTDMFNIPFNYTNIDCMFKKTPDKNAPLLLLCYARKRGKGFFGRIEYMNLTNINIEYNFIISQASNYELFSVNNTGGIILTVYPEVLNFTKEECFKIRIVIDKELNGIRLNPDSLEDLICEFKDKYLDCLICKNHFGNKPNGYYNINYLNYLNKYSIKYESSIYVILTKESQKETDPEGIEGENNNNNSQMYIIIGICVPIGIIIIVISLYFFFLWRKKNNSGNEERKDNNGYMIPLTESMQN